MQKLAINIFINFLQNPPDHFLLEKLKKENFWQKWFLKNDSPLQQKALDLLINSDEDDKTIGCDFTNLFLSSIDFVKSPPFASFYLDKSKEIYSCNSDKVKSIFHQNNFLTYLHDEPADSAINELLFIQYLITAKNNEILKEFLNKEFLPWFNIWSLDIINKAETDFYKALAMLMQDFFNHLNTEF